MDSICNGQFAPDSQAYMSAPFMEASSSISPSAHDNKLVNKAGLLISREVQS